MACLAVIDFLTQPILTDNPSVQGLPSPYFCEAFDAVAFELSQLSGDSNPQAMEAFAEESTAILEVQGRTCLSLHLQTSK